MPDTGVALNTDTALDLWKITLRSHDWKNKKLEVLFDYHNFIVTDQWFREDKMEVEGGTEIERQVVYRNSGNASFVKPGEVRTRSTMNVVATIRLQFVNMTKNFSILEGELLANRGREVLKKAADVRRADTLVAICNTLEERAWQLPSTATDNTLPHGIPYYLPPITAAQVTSSGSYGLDSTGAHQGTAASGFTTVMGINPGTFSGGWDSDEYKLWRSYNGTWTNSAGDITEDDLLRVGKMFRHLHFKAPMVAGDIEKPKFQKTRIYACETIVDSFSKAARRQNDALGSDTGRYFGAGIAQSGEPTFRGMPLIWTEYIDTDTTFPLYMLNHDYFFPIVRRGLWIREGATMNDVEQPDVFTTHVDSQFNFFCKNRRLAGGVLTYVAAG